ncbi:heat shock 70 kDa protein 14-like [Acanthaster planci]|uniref:Heat shock 70 kDa protein 14 n=1 Tax=Acanthaster planci TaxID=133434 RepID=A0A8B7Z0Q8_ACAPL|nr:heat shock 70 kDa protein 14-like [Acanthaster planci]
MAASLGIYFGGSTTCLAISKDGKTEVITNDSGDRVTPAIVAYNGNDKDVGLSAKQGKIRNAVNTICHVKHTLGRRVEDNIVKQKIRDGPTKIIDKSGYPLYQVDYKDKVTYVTPTAVATLIFKKLKEIALHQGGIGDDRDVVLTIPLDFSETQRRSLCEAATDAGFNILRIISEPSAAVLAYGVCDTKSADKSNVLVYRLGGTSLTITILQVSNGMLRVLASETDLCCGGDTFTSLLAKSCASDFNRTRNCNMSDNKRAMNKLHGACEISKHILSTLPSAKCSIDSLYDGIDYHTNISRVKFEALINSHAQQSIELLKKLITEADLKPDHIHKVLLVGGSTRIPKLQQMIRDVLPKAEMLDTISPDEVIALGAAKEAALLSTRDDSIQLKEADIMASCCTKAVALKVIDPTEDANLEIVIPQYSYLPIRRQYDFNIGKEQTSVCVQIYETQEGASIEESSLLAQIVIDGLETDSDEDFHVTSVFHYRRDGSLHIICCEDITGKTEEILIGPVGHGSSQSDTILNEQRDA